MPVGYWKHTLDLWVDGIPTGQPRPRAYVRQKAVAGVVPARAGVYSPRPARGWFDLVYASALAARSRLDRLASLEGPIRVDVTLYLPRPKRLMRKCDPDGPVWAVTKPDRDNADKVILDALQTAGYFRDHQVVAGTIEKLYPKKGELAGAVISVSIWEAQH